jgi:Mce-associated membrane protein
VSDAPTERPDAPKEPPGEPQRTRFVDPPPAPVVSAPVEMPPAPVEPTPEPEPEPAEATEQLTEQPTEQPTEESTEEPPHPPRAASTWVLALLLVVLLAGIGGLSWWIWALTHQNGNRFAKDGDPALRAAKAAASLVLAYDYRSLDKGFAAASQVTTDADGPSCPHKVDPKDPAYDPKARCFKSEYSRTHDLVVKDVATRYKVIVVADVSAGGVESVNGDLVTVLLYVNQQSTNSNAATPKITQARVEMIMQKVRGRWLVAGVSAL